MTTLSLVLLDKDILSASCRQPQYMQTFTDGVN